MSAPRSFQLAVRLPAMAGGTVLRRLQPGDLEIFHGYRSDEEVARYQGWAPMSRAEAGAFLAEMSDAAALPAGEWIQLGIAEHPSGSLVGDVGLYLAGDLDFAEVGFTLARDAQGKGHATRAVQAAVSLLFDCTPVPRVLGITDARNLASVRVLERAGFRFAEPRETIFKGEPCRELVYVSDRPA